MPSTPKPSTYATVAASSARHATGFSKPSAPPNAAIVETEVVQIILSVDIDETFEATSEAELVAVRDEIAKTIAEDLNIDEALVSVRFVVQFFATIGNSTSPVDTTDGCEDDTTLSEATDLCVPKPWDDFVSCDVERQQGACAC